ncbi:efflux RND transporter periplasmic adaptor subunit [Roseobacteraceae bacterium S113]
MTLAVAAGAVFAVQFGAAELTRRADAAPTPKPADILPVTASPIRWEEGYTVTRAFIGQVEAQKTARLSFELNGRLDEIFVDEGDQVLKGQILATQDLALLHAEQTQLQASREAAEAQLRFAEQTLARNTALKERGFTSQAGLDEAQSRQDELRARIAETDAALSAVAIRLEKSQILAPFDGRVTSRLVDGGEPLAGGQQVLGLVALDQPQVRIGVPLDLDETRLSDVRIEIEGLLHTAQLLTLRPDIDPVTRTRIALFELKSTAQPAFGQTARLLVDEAITARGLWIPTPNLKEGLRGQWTVLSVDADNLVRAASVEILHAESDRVFVRAALPEGTRLIEAGPQRVTLGQRVSVDTQM